MCVNGIVKKSSIYLFSAFVSGAAVMAVEMSGTRILAPYFGNSLYVWTNLLGLVMMALAAGYFFGGRLSDKKPKPELYFTLFFAAGLWVLLLPFVATPIFKLLFYVFSNFANTVPLGSFVAVSLLFVVPMFFLGMVLPFTVKLITAHVEHVGSVSGKVSMVSTVGSLVGTFLPAFILIPILGTTKTFILIAVILMLTAAMGLRKIFFGFFPVASVLIILMGWLSASSVPPVYAQSDIIFSKDSAYGFVFVTEDEEGIRRLHVNSPIGTQSLYDPESALPPEGYYYSYFGVLPAMMEDPKNVLILGHAGGSFTRIFNAYYPELDITGVEIDPLMTEVSMKYMGLEDADVDIVHADARTYLLSTEESYDLILIDTYQSMNIPSHLATHEFFALVASRLNSGGLVALNAASGESDFLYVLGNSMAKNFAFSGILKIPDSYNSILLGSATQDFTFLSDIPEALRDKAVYVSKNLLALFYDSSREVFTDEKATRAEILNDEMHLEIYKNF